MTNLNERVKFFCFKICEELEIDPEQYDLDSNYPSGQTWMQFEDMVRDWLVNEAFRQVRSEHWDREARKETKITNTANTLVKTV